MRYQITDQERHVKTIAIECNSSMILSPRWVKPVLVVQVEYRKRTGEGLRHAALKGLRPINRHGG